MRATRPTDDALEVDKVSAGIIRELERRRSKRRPEAPPRWWRAIEIARRFRIREGSGDDSRKRGVRRIMTMIAEDRSDLIASFRGYALARDAADLRRHKDWLRRMGLHQLAHAHRVTRSAAYDDATGQLRLSEPRRYRGPRCTLVREKAARKSESNRSHGAPSCGLA